MKQTILLVVIFILGSTLLYLEQERRMVRVLSVPIHTYHDVVDEGESSIANVWMRRSELVSHLQAYKNKGFETISMADLVAYTKFKKLSLPKKPLIITFDDTWKGHVEYALPLLLEYNFTATFYINSGWVDSNDRFMDWDDVRILHESGMEIGGHTINHTELTEDLTEQIIGREVREDKLRIETELGEAINTFAYPYNTYSDALIRLIKEVGYTSSRTGKGSDKKSLHSLPSTIH